MILVTVPQVIYNTRPYDNGVSAKLCNYGVMTREPVEGFVYLAVGYTAVLRVFSKVIF